MARYPVENNFITRFLLGFGVLAAMIFGGSVVAWILVSLEIPYGGGIGMILGAFVVFLLFSLWYSSYDAGFDSE